VESFKLHALSSLPTSILVAFGLLLTQLIGTGRAVTIAVPQTPDDLCQCSGDDSASRGGIRTFEEFSAKFGAGFPTRAELDLAWRVYKAVNRCNSVVVLGRLADTDQFMRRSSYCVLRNLDGWTMRVNEVFVRAATDRGAKIQLVSEMPPEIMGGEVDVTAISPENRERNWIVIYNNEIQWVLRTGEYRLVYDKNKKITPAEPGYLLPASAATPPGRGVLQLATITPDPKCETWNIYSACDPKGGQIVARASWGTANYKWTPPPATIPAEGLTITLTVSEETPPNNRVATGLNLTAGGFELDPGNASLPIGAPNQPSSGNLTVAVKPPKNLFGDHYLKIGVFWGPGFTYHYRVMP